MIRRTMTPPVGQQLGQTQGAPASLPLTGQVVPPSLHVHHMDGH
jgi:hypothetical protein